jgi:hypothetical protein
MPDKTLGLLRLPVGFGLIILYGLSVSAGILFALSGFMDPDSCWLVRTGQLILTTHAIPATDPFSFTIPMMSVTGVHQAFVVYQWLTEVIFASVFNAFELRGLLCLCSLVACVASLPVLARTCLSTNAKPVFCFLVVALAFGAVAVRLIVRPEIFTLLALSLWLFLLQPLLKTSPSAQNQSQPEVFGPPRFEKKRCMLLALLTIAWCNLHSGFVIGLAYLAVVCLASLLELLAAKNREQILHLQGSAKAAILYMVCCLVASCLNPYGVNLWHYLPHLFFSPFAPFLDELLPLSSVLFSQPIYYAFFALAAVSILLVLKILPGSFSQKTPLTGAFRSVILLVAALLLAVFCRRLISPLSLIIAVECCRLFALLKPVGKDESSSVKTFLRPLRSLYLMELPVALLSMGAVLFFADRLVPLTMPQTTDTFQPPFKAVTYLLNNWHGGNTFSTLQIASLLEMYGPRQMKQFADTRIDVYPPMIIKSYMDIISAETSCPELLRRYDVSWAVLTPHTHLGAYLAKSHDWEKTYEDENSEIFHKIAGALPY